MRAARGEAGAALQVRAHSISEVLDTAVAVRGGPALLRVILAGPVVCAVVCRRVRPLARLLNGRQAGRREVVGAGAGGGAGRGESLQVLARDLREVAAVPPVDAAHEEAGAEREADEDCVDEDHDLLSREQVERGRGRLAHIADKRVFHIAIGVVPPPAQPHLAAVVLEVRVLVVVRLALLPPREEDRRPFHLERQEGHR
mmetsp:Transcript_351/g.1240  ORF Transcript_351/g.1240 Transcript_351/m.1240 type:complete len:200 (-) Transcript_351:1416-2015(-)